MWQHSEPIDFESDDDSSEFIITREGILILFVATILSLIGLFLNIRFFWVSSLTVLVAFAMFMVKFVLIDYDPIKLNLEIPAIQIKAKQFITVHIQAESEREIPLFIELQTSSGLIEVLRKSNGIIHSGQKGSTWVFYAPRRGSEELSSLFIQFDGLFSLFYLGKTISINKRIVVLPQPQRVTLPWTMKQRIFDQFLAEIQINRKGRGDSFLSLRDFQYGDELRHIHWKSTARHNRLITKEFEEPIMLRFLIVVNKSLLMAGPKLEFVLSSVVELASVIRSSNHTLTILVHGDKETWKYNLGNSPASFKELGIHLHGVRPEGPEFNYTTLLQYIQSHQLTDTVMIILSDMEQDPKSVNSGYVMLQPYFQRLIYFACYTPGFGTMNYNRIRGKNIHNRDQLYYRKHILTPKILRVYENRRQSYSEILNQSRSKFHIIDTYETNILLELQSTLKLMSPSRGSKRTVRNPL